MRKRERTPWRILVDLEPTGEATDVQILCALCSNGVGEQQCYQPGEVGGGKGLQPDAGSKSGKRNDCSNSHDSTS